jgi:RNA polymerase sigma factor (sigma-70 family)
LELTARTYYDDRIESCKQGNPAAFKDLYRQYAAAMYNTSLRIVNNATDAEDIVQESFIAAFRKIDDFDYQSSFGAWMKRIVINRSLNHLRSRKIKFIDIGSTSLSGQEEESAVNEEEFGFRVDEVKKAVALLPDGYRTVFTLSAFEGYANEQIASLLGITPSTVRTQYHRARKQLLLIIKGDRHEK